MFRSLSCSHKKNTKDEPDKCDCLLCTGTSLPSWDPVRGNLDHQIQLWASNGHPGLHWKTKSISQRRPNPPPRTENAENVDRSRQKTFALDSGESGGTSLLVRHQVTLDGNQNWDAFAVESDEGNSVDPA